MGVRTSVVLSAGFLSIHINDAITPLQEGAIRILDTAKAVMVSMFFLSSGLVPYCIGFPAFRRGSEYYCVMCCIVKASVFVLNNGSCLGEYMESGKCTLFTPWQ